jgi:hypothetical protein
VSPITRFQFGFISVFFVAVGGSERFVGPVIGAVVLTMLPDLLSSPAISGWCWEYRACDRRTFPQRSGNFTISAGAGSSTVAHAGQP